jgi:phage repressor protein C with HTH and peptisase S24 domain
MLKIIKVTGNSLSPFFLSGDYVLVSTFPRSFKRLHADDSVVFTHPDYGLLIKHVRRNFLDSKKLEVIGSHKDSISSQKLGLIPYSDIIGKVIFHIKQSRLSN